MVIAHVQAIVEPAGVQVLCVALVLDLDWARSVHKSLLVGRCGLLSRCSAAKASTDFKELTPVSDLANTADAVAAKVDPLGLILPHLIISDLSNRLRLMAALTFPFSFPLCEVGVHFCAAFESKIAVLWVDSG